MLKSLRYQAGWLGKLDAILHALHCPAWLMRPVCDRYEATVCEGSPYIYIGDQTYTSSSGSSITWTWSTPRKPHGGK